jgi:hypothetical protein
MAKCCVCNSRKGKRQCLANAAAICSLCCGQTRKLDKCGSCGFCGKESSARNYRQVPFIELQEMADSYELQDISYVVEALFVSFDQEHESFTDSTAGKLLELAFDKFHFRDSDLSFGKDLEKVLFERMLQVIAEDLSTTHKDLLVKVLAAIYRSIQRRTEGGREYLQFTRQYVGERIATGTGARKR